MKREEYIHITITKDEKEQIIRKLSEKITEDGKAYTISTYLREFAIKPLINGSSSPPQETVIETVNETEPETPNNRWDDIEF